MAHLSGFREGLHLLRKMARLRRFERPTPAFGGQYSIQLSYRRFGPICVTECSRHFTSPTADDDCLRRAVLYPTELQALWANLRDRVQWLFYASDYG